MGPKQTHPLLLSLQNEELLLVLFFQNIQALQICHEHCVFKNSTSFLLFFRGGQGTINRSSIDYQQCRFKHCIILIVRPLCDFQ